MTTYFAPAKRTDWSVFSSQVADISNNPILNELLNITGGVLVLVNEDRQIVGVNKVFMDTLGISDPSVALGLRLGEILYCINSSQPPNGCGTTPPCATCGAAIAMMGAISEDKMLDQTCVLAAEKNGTKIERCLSVKAVPIKVDGRRWVMILAQDGADQHSYTSKVENLLHGVKDLLAEMDATEEQPVSANQDIAQRIQRAVEELSIEIALHHVLRHEEESELLLHKNPVSVDEIRRELQLQLDGYADIADRNLQQQWPAADVRLTTNIHLLARILANMLLTVRDATREGGTVRLDTAVNEDVIMWEVSSEVYIPSAIQHAMFQKNKSTPERGIGNYAMKLLGEHYLNGKISFASTEEDGTVIRFEHSLHL